MQQGTLSAALTPDVAIYSQFGDPVELLQMVVNVVRLPGPPW
ncbi:MAG: hypothetical protein OSB03_06740 [Vicinamibacterales bacterium]|nr:hypothetical protein [Vicinamibacterales bacterium]